jgi:hypothetical protein
MGLFSFLGCSKPKESAQTPAAQQKISLPSPADLERLAKQRAVIEHYLGDDDSRTKYKMPAGKLGLLRALLAQQVFKPTQTYELQCMGIVLGDTFVQEMGMEWITVEDEHGSDPAVRLPGTTIIIYPLTMISKRVERGETVDVFALFNGVADQIDQIKAKTK